MQPPAKFPAQPRALPSFPDVPSSVPEVPAETSTVVQTIVIPPGSTSTVTTIVDQNTPSGKPTVTSVIRPVPQMTEPAAVVLPLMLDVQATPDGRARTATPHRHDAPHKGSAHPQAVPKAHAASPAAGGPGEAAAPSAKTTAMPTNEMIPESLAAALRSLPALPGNVPVGVVAAPDQATSAASPEQAIAVAVISETASTGLPDVATPGAAPSQAAYVTPAVVLPDEIAAAMKMYNAMYNAQALQGALTSQVPETAPAPTVDQVSTVAAAPAQELPAELALPLPVQEVPLFVEDMGAATGTPLPAEGSATTFAGAPLAGNRVWLARTFTADAELLPVSESVFATTP